MPKGVFYFSANTVSGGKSACCLRFSSISFSFTLDHAMCGKKKPLLGYAGAFLCFRQYIVFVMDPIEKAAVLSLCQKFFDTVKGLLQVCHAGCVGHADMRIRPERQSRHGGNHFFVKQFRRKVH